MTDLTLLVVHAHPDDEANSTGGTLARYSAEGLRTVLVTCTNGEFGDAPGRVKPGDDGHDPEAVARLRLHELERAAAALGVTHTVALGYRDSGMKGWPQNEHPDAFSRQPVDVVAARVVALFEEFRPQVVITYFDAMGYNHPDHLHAHAVTLAAIERGPVPSKLYLIARPHSYRERMGEVAAEYGVDLPPFLRPPEPPDPVGPSAPPPENPPRPFGVDDALITTTIDVRAYVAQKRAALAAHASQLEGSFFLQFPPEGFARAFGRETFIRAQDATGAPTPEDDLFAGLR
jgi:LmbE family N-acetylglucosaminyl deacetylase